MSFGYATAEFEVTDERLGVYRPEEHIDNPKDYADNVDARQYDQRLRPPVAPEELAIDPNTGMKNYIANESGGWATSAGYIKYSFARAIHFGRTYTHGANKHREEDLCEALRCLGQGLHCLEDFGAHTNYTELALRELGFHNVFPHVGAATQINLHGKQVFPLVTGTFGGVDFLHSVIGEANDHVTQSEVEEMNDALGGAATQGKRSGGGPENEVSGLTSLLSKVPGTGSLCQEAVSLQAASDAQAAANSGGGSGYGGGYESSRAWNPTSFAAPPGSQGGPPGPGIPGVTTTDPQEIIRKIYPILEFRDKVVRAVSSIISKIPGLENLIDKITERVTLFVMGLLAPYIQPLVAAASASLKQGSSAVVDSSAQHQYQVFDDPHCSDPTHSMLSKDHFSNILNEPAGQVAACILQYVAPRVIYAWDHPDVPEQQVLDDIVRVFHHPAIRDQSCEIHRNMFNVVEKWAHSRPNRGDLDNILSTESVRAGRNHSGGVNPHGGHGANAGGPMAMFGQKRDINADNDISNVPPQQYGGYTQPQQSQDSYGGPPSGDYHHQQQPPLSDYNQQSYSQGQGYEQPPAAGFVQHDPYAYPTAYQQGYQIPFDQGPAGYGGPQIPGAPPPGPQGPPGPPGPSGQEYGQHRQYDPYNQQYQGQQGGYGGGGYGGYDSNPRY